jgi:hypothetical protein
MYSNISAAGTPADSKYVKATGSLILLNPNLFISLKSVSFIAPCLNEFLFQVCSSHEKLMPLLRVAARLKTSARAFIFFGLLFAIGHVVAIHNNINKQYNNRV